MSRRISVPESLRFSSGASGSMASVTHVCAALTSCHDPATALMQGCLHSRSVWTLGMSSKFTSKSHPLGWD
eukprot:6935665-Pyramimonas_sp.AAC.1